MKKLTAERCRRQIEEWQRMMSVSDVAVMVELNLQAYVLALPILEQQERGEGEWIRWGGGECPVPGALIDARYRAGFEVSGLIAGEPTDGCPNAHQAYWDNDDSPLDIIAYRIIPERATNQNGEQ